MKNQILKISLFTSILFLAGCKHDEFDAEYYAKQYCDCLKKERASGKDFFDARTKCDGVLLARNKFYRTTYNESTYWYYMDFLPASFNDSVIKFKNTFYEYVEKNCCKEGFIGCDKNDSLQIKRDTALKQLKKDNQ